MGKTPAQAAGIALGMTRVRRAATRTIVDQAVAKRREALVILPAVRVAESSQVDRARVWAGRAVVRASAAHEILRYDTIEA